MIVERAAQIHRRINRFKDGQIRRGLYGDEFNCLAFRNSITRFLQVDGEPVSLI
jgi:hypothetical protein